MPRFAASIVIDRPVEEVFAYTIDPENDALWQLGVDSSELTSDGPIGVGTTGRRVMNFLGHRVDSTWECTEYVPDRKWAARSVVAPFPFRGTRTFESVEGGTRVRWEGEAEGPYGLFGRMADPLIMRLFARQVRSSLVNLKALLEEQTESGG